MFIVVFRCSACGKMHYDASNMRKHIANACPTAHLEKLQGVVVVDEGSQGTHRLKPGPKPMELGKHLHGRLAAFTTQSDDERIEYIFSSGLVETLFTTRIEDIPALFFKHLWSSMALEQFQSLVMYRNVIHEIIAFDIDTGDVRYAVRGALTKRFIKEFAVYALELAYAVAKDSIPARRPELIPEGRDLFERLCRHTDGMTLRDAIKQSGTYTKNAFAMRHKLDHTLSTVSDTMHSMFATCFT